MLGINEEQSEQRDSIEKETPTVAAVPNSRTNRRLLSSYELTAERTTSTGQCGIEWNGGAAAAAKIVVRY